MSLFAELKRRNVVRVGAAYAVIAWALAQVAEFAFSNFGAPDWALKAVVLILLLGLPLALFFAWAFELTPDGVKREKDVDRTASITSTTGRKLDRIVIGVLIVVLGWFAWDKFSVPSVELDTGLVVASTSERSVAVLPFVAMSTGEDDGYFADGLTEEILNSLAQLPELLVTSRTSAFTFRGTELPVQEIAAALGVAHVVEGSVRRSGERLRVTAQLIRASDDVHLWSETYDSIETDTIAVQEDIAEKIAVAMNIVLDEDKRAAMRKAGLRDPEAFTLYQKATELYNRAHGETETVAGLREANVYYEQVMQRAPNFVHAYINHADLALHMVLDDIVGRNIDDYSYQDIENTLAEVAENYETVVRVAPTEDLRALVELDSVILSNDWRRLPRAVERALATTICVDGNTTSWIANVVGYAEENVERLRRRLACDPLRSLSWFDLARAQLWSGDVAGALLTAKEGQEVAPGTWLDNEIIRILVAHREYDEATNGVAELHSFGDPGILFEAMIAAHRGDASLYLEKAAVYEQNEVFVDKFWLLSLYAWGGQLEKANRVAAKMDEHPYGTIALLNILQWCACGAPWELKATPNLAKKVVEGNISWPPAPALVFPLKTW